VARRGLGAATGKRVSNASRVWREAVDDAQAAPTSRRGVGPASPAGPSDGGPEQRGREGRPVPPRPERGEDIEARRSEQQAVSRAAREEEEWVLVEDVRGEAERAVGRGSAGRRGDATAAGVPDLAEEVRQQLSRAVGNARSERVERRLKEAAEAFDHERFGDAARILKKLSDEAPTVAAVRELYGLTLYRQEKWRSAAKELEAYRLLADSVDQHPVLADCYRALHHWPMVDELWTELGAASPNAEIVTEGRIVTAGALADRGQLVPAIRLLEQGWRFPKRPKFHHLRRAYALADLYERAGEVPRAQDLFRRIEAADPDFADVHRRVRNLR
jgi:tetratricopeptide (TPR) repeat protein